MVMETILAVDDQLTIRSMIKAILDGAGYDVITASDGNEAIGLAQSNQFDMVITDINMPNMNGFDLLQNIKKMPDYNHIPILMLTTETSSIKKSIAKGAGANGWLSKPFNPTRLLTAVEKMINK